MNARLSSNSVLPNMVFCDSNTCVLLIFSRASDYALSRKCRVILYLHLCDKKKVGWKGDFDLKYASM